MQQQDASRRGRGTGSNQSPDRPGVANLASSSSSSVNSSDTGSSSSNQDILGTLPKDLRETPPGSPSTAASGKYSPSPESRKRSASAEGRRHASKTAMASSESSPSRQASPGTTKKSSSPRSAHRQSPSNSRKATSLEVASAASQGSPNNGARGILDGTSTQSPQRSPSKGATHSSNEDGPLMGGISDESIEVDTSLSASSSGTGGSDDDRRFADALDDNTVPGELSLASNNHPQSLSATVSRGAFHQCGTARRVKVYELKGETWFDRGTGYCAGVYDEQHDAALLVARMEEGCHKLTVMPEDGEESECLTSETAEQADKVGVDGKEDRDHFMLVVSDQLGEEELLLKTRVVKEDVYQRQQDTLVVWTEPDGTDMALSFQEADGCHEVWEFLTEVQKHFILNARQVGEGLAIDEGDSENIPPGALGISTTGMVSEGELVMSDGSAFNLPLPTFQSLEVIDLTLKDAASRSPQAREKVAEWILRDEYLLKLIPLFHEAEELEQLEELHRLCNVMHTILMLNDSVLVERILRDDVFLGAVGMLEYDPEFPSLKASYRDYLIHTTRFRQVVNIHDASILNKIHQTFRLQYLKDVVLARILDDSTFAVLNSLIFYHQADIVAFCSSSEVFLVSLFQIFDKSQTHSEEKKAEAIIFLQQLCAMGKQVQLPSRIGLYRTLTEWGLLLVLEYALTRTEARLRNAAAEVLMTITEYDAMGVRAHVLEQVDKETVPLITKLGHILHEGHGDLGLKTQITESMRILFDSGPDGSSGGPNVAQTLAAAAAAAAAASNDGGRAQKDDADRFLNWFYDGEVDHLFSPLKNLTTFKELSQQATLSKRAAVIDITSPAKSALFNHLCDLLTFIMVHHHFRSQYWVISSDISMRVATLLFAREKHLRLAALRFFRACLAKGNQFINRHFVKIELLSAVLAVVEGESARDNLVTSACLDFFEHIRRENMRHLIAHLLENHEARVRALTENSTVGLYFQALLMLWEKNNAPAPSSFTEGESSMSSLQEAEKHRRIRDIARRGENRAIMDSDEENYFNEDEDDDDEEETPLQPAEELSGKASTSGEGPALGLVHYTDDDSGEAEVGAVAGLIHPQQVRAESNTGTLSGESISEGPLKRKKREAEEDEDDDMMGRLAKRKSISISEEDQGGFIRDDIEPAAQVNTKNGAANPPKRLSINLMPSSEKRIEKDS